MKKEILVVDDEQEVNHKVKMLYVSIVPEKEVSMEDVDGFIQKPFSPEEFLATIKKVLGD